MTNWAENPPNGVAVGPGTGVPVATGAGVSVAVTVETGVTVEGEVLDGSGVTFPVGGGIESIVG